MLKFLNIILFIITFITVFFNPIIFLILLLIGIYNIFNIRKKMDLFISDVEYLETITKKIDNLNITIANCRRFLNSRTIKEDISIIENKKEKNVSDVKNIILANEAIEKVIGTGVIEDFSENLKQDMIKILQDDLTTDESDLTLLLNKALEKIARENSNINDDFCKKLTKNDKK